MNSHDFVKGLGIRVGDGSQNGVRKILHSPGKGASEKEIELSIWYKSLGDEDRKHVDFLVTNSISRTVFNFLCVLDGVAAVECGPEKGELIHSYENQKKGICTLINDSKNEALHDLWDWGM